MAASGFVCISLQFANCAFLSIYPVIICRQPNKTENWAVFTKINVDNKFSYFPPRIAMEIFQCVYCRRFIFRFSCCCADMILLLNKMLLAFIRIRDISKHVILNLHSTESWYFTYLDETCSCSKAHVCALCKQLYTIAKF